MVSEECRLPDPNKAKIIVELLEPEIMPKVQSALGHIGWYYEAIEDYANTAIPLSNLTKKDIPFSWTQECQNIFVILKDKLTNVSYLISIN